MPSDDPRAVAPRGRPGAGSTAAGGRALRAGRERGSVTVELAASIPVLMLLVTAGLAAVSAMIAQQRCVDAAAEGARLAARDDPAATDAARRIAPPGAQVAIGRTGDLVRVTVSTQFPLLGWTGLRLQGVALAEAEPDAPWGLQSVPP